MPKPDLPDSWPRLPRDVHRDLRGASPAAHLDDVSAAFFAAGEALEAGDLDRAVELLEWAKSVAPRSVVVREALGVALYRSGAFGEARAELQTYRRISGRDDQLHLLADCVRAEGRADLVERYIGELLASDVDMTRKVEGVLVLAGTRADAGDVDGALAALRRVDVERLPAGEPFARHQYLAGDLLERVGRSEEAAAAFARVADVAPDYLDVAARLGPPAGDEEVTRRRAGGSSA